MACSATAVDIAHDRNPSAASERMLAPSTQVVVVDPYTDSYRWQGWGVTLGHDEAQRRQDGWADRRAYLDLLYDPNADGLRLNMVRFLVGGGARPNAPPRQVDYYTDPAKRPCDIALHPAWGVADCSADPGLQSCFDPMLHNAGWGCPGDFPGGCPQPSDPWQRPADANGCPGNAGTCPAGLRPDRKVRELEHVVSRLTAANIDPIIELITYSAPWWMTENGCESGPTNKHENNVADIEDFAFYVARVAKIIEQTLEQRFGRYGTEIDYITHNDPSHHWQADNLKQPGLYMSPEQIVQWVAALQGRIAEEGLRSARVSVFDNDRFDHTLANLDFLRRNASAQSLAAVGKINPHPQFGPLLRELRQLARRLGKDIWTVGGGCCNGMHFTGHHDPQRTFNADYPSAGANGASHINFGSAEAVADYTVEMIKYLRVRGAHYINPSWGMLGWHQGGWFERPQFRALKLMTRGLPAGSWIYSVSDGRTVAGAHRRDGVWTLTLVAVNRGQSEVSDVAYDLGAFNLGEAATATVEVLRPHPEVNWDSVLEHSEIPLQQGRYLQVSLPAHSVVRMTVVGVARKEIRAALKQIIDDQQTDAAASSLVRAMTYNGTWSKRRDPNDVGAPYRNTVSWTQQSGATVSLTFEGTRLQLYGMTQGVARSETLNGPLYAHPAHGGGSVALSQNGGELQRFRVRLGGTGRINRDWRKGDVMVYDTGPLPRGVYTVTATRTSGAFAIDRFVVIDATQSAADRIGVWTTDRRIIVDRNHDELSATDAIVGPFGRPGDIPLVGDVDGDGDDDVGVYRPTTRRFYFDLNGDGQWNAGGGSADRALGPFGNPGDRPVVGRWPNRLHDRDMIGVFRPGNQRFYLDLNGNGVWDSGTDAASQAFGRQNDVPIVGDWNGDGTEQLGVARWSTGHGAWTFALDDGSMAWGDGDRECVFGGTAHAVPISGDFNGDGSDSVGIYNRNDRRFYLNTDQDCTLGADDRVTPAYGPDGQDRPLVGRW